jgi:hypothetical protein
LISSFSFCHRLVFSNLKTFTACGRWLTLSAAIILLAAGVVQSQGYPSTFEGRPGPAQLANGQITIIAVMVEFQQQENRFTTGDGTFNPSFLDRPGITIDPLPHDRGYFEAHLQFTKNYFERVSGGRLTVNYEVLPEIITVPGVMADYSPLGEDGSQNEKLAFFARDVWSEVDRRGFLVGRTLDPDRTMYIAFHAGAGRDLELVGTSLDKTPQDIPSVYLSRDSFRRLFGNEQFPGFLVNGIEVSNTAILPETQSRPGTNIVGEEFVLQLSINGITAAMVGSFLGLPDLFNTENGRSGIGRFGLMDGAGFFSHFGLFPPEPSAWEKYWLGWVDPVDITSLTDAGGTVSLDASAPGQVSTTVKLPVSSDEYFLVENRIRDPQGRGLELTIRTPDGRLETVRIARDEERFDPFDFSKIDEILPAGVLVDVSHFDWSLPGGLDRGEDGRAGTEDDRFLNGGILIWHIDEQIIRSNYVSNSINNDPLRRGVRLVEADAAQDIGRPAGGLTRYDQGAPFDFWWSGNDFTVITQNGQRIVLYQNRFADDTRPNNRSNSGAPTYFEFYDFSDTGVEMTFRTRRVSSAGFEPLLGMAVSAGVGISQPLGGLSGFPMSVSRVVSGVDTLIVFPHSGGMVVASTAEGSVQRIGFESGGQPVAGSGVLTVLERGAATVGAGAGVLRGYRVDRVLAGESDGKDLAGDGTGGGTGFLRPGPAGPVPGLVPVWQAVSVDAGGAGLVARFAPQAGFVGAVPSRFVFAEMNGDAGQVLEASTQIAVRDGAVGGRLTGTDVLNATGQRIFSINTPESLAPRRYLMSTSPGPDLEPAFLLITRERFVILNATDGTIHTTINAQTAGWPALASWSGTSLPALFFVDHHTNTIEGLNLLGASLNGFPVTAPDGFTFTGTPLILPADNSNDQLFMVMASDGYSLNILVYTSQNLRYPTETLLVGSERPGSHPLQPAIFNGNLYAASPSGDLRAWRIRNRQDQPTSYLYGNPSTNTPGIEISPAAPPFTTGLMVNTEVYNWPNPASDHTHIRFMTTEPSEITVTTIDYSGQQVHESRHSTVGGLPQEYRLNTSSWGNGVYFTRVTARSGSAIEHKVFTMVIIR